MVIPSIHATILNPNSMSKFEPQGSAFSMPQATLSHIEYPTHCPIDEKAMTIMM